MLSSLDMKQNTGKVAVCHCNNEQEGRLCDVSENSKLHEIKTWNKVIFLYFVVFTVDIKLLSGPPWTHHMVSSHLWLETMWLNEKIATFSMLQIPFHNNKSSKYDGIIRGDMMCMLCTFWYEKIKATQINLLLFINDQIK